MVVHKTMPSKNPICPNCGKPLTKIFVNMKVEGRKIPTVFRSQYDRDHAKSHRILSLKMRMYRRESEWVCWLGQFRVADGHFCTEICSGRFAKHAFETGFRRKDKEALSKKPEKPKAKEYAFSVKLGRLVPVTV